MFVPLSMVVVMVIAMASCQTKPKVSPHTSTDVDTARLGEAVAKADKNQDQIKKDGESLAKDLPEDERPPRIVDNAVDTKVQLKLAKQTIEDLKLKEGENKKASEDNAHALAQLEAENAALQEEIDSGTAWFFFLMIAGGAIGIPIGLAIALKIDKAWGTFVLIVAVGSVVTGFVLRDYACWIAPIGGIVALVACGILGWRRLTEHEDQAAEDEAVLLETVRSAEAMKDLVPDWHKPEVQEQITRHQTPETVERIKQIRVQDKLTKNPEHLVAMA